MKGLFKKGVPKKSLIFGGSSIEDLFVAVTFAEAGELDTARQILNERSQENRRFSGIGEETGKVEDYSAGIRPAEEKRKLTTQTVKP